MMTDPDPRIEALAAVVALVYPDQPQDWCRDYANAYAYAHAIAILHGHAHAHAYAHPRAYAHAHAHAYAHAHATTTLTPEQQRITDAYILLFG